MKILITGAGGAAAISVWKSLAEEHQIFMTDMDPCAAGLYLVPETQRSLIPRGDSPEFIPSLLKLCKYHQIDVLIPTVDTELFSVAKHAETFNALGTKIPLSPAQTLELCRDKYSLLSFCQETGFTPQYTLLTPETDLTTLSLPCFAKPRCGAGSTGTMTINHQSEFAVLPKDSSYLIQEVLPGEEYSVDVYIHSDGTPLAAVPRLRMKIDSGIAVAARTCINPQLSKMAIEIAQKAGITYIANVQFKANQHGEFKLLEINPRFPGTLPLTAAAGIDIPRLLIDDLQGKPFKPELLPFKELMVVRYWAEEFFNVNEWKKLQIPSPISEEG